MNKEFIQKTIRCIAVSLCFLCILTIVGMKEREAQQFAMMLVIMAMFGFLLRNIWLSLFLWWTIILFVVFKFNIGSVYLSNVFYGCILYYMARLVFAKKHVTFFINAILWLVVINCLYMAVQVLGFDFIYEGAHHETQVGDIYQNTLPLGFMGNAGYLGCLLALAIPLLATRNSLTSKIGTIGLFFPLYIAHSSLCIGAGVICLIFIMWYRISHVVVIILAILMLAGVGFYALKLDSEVNTIRIQHWKNVLGYAVQHPIKGWGLDSFRNTTKDKDFKFYWRTWEAEGRKYIEWWDNPHNIFISLFFEFGIFGVFIFCGYLRNCAVRFIRSIKDNNTLAMAGFMLVMFIASLAHFPMFLARTAVLGIIGASLFEVQTDG